MHARQIHSLFRSLLLLCALTLGATLPASAVSIQKVEWTLTPIGATPAADANWTTLGLPLRWPAPEGSPLQGLALRMTFDLAERPPEAWAVLVGQATNGGSVSVNGRFIGAIRMADAETHVRWRRPHVLAIDPELLAAGQNVLLIQTAFRGGVHVLSDIEVGPLNQMSKRYEREFFPAYTLTWIGATLAAVIALLFGVLWLRRPEPLLALLTVAAAMWVLRSSYFLLETMPLDMRYWLRLAYFVASGLFAAVMTLAMLRLSGREEPRDSFAIFSFALFGPLLFVVTGQHAAPYLDRLWVPALILVCALGFGYAVLNRVRGRESPHPILMVAMVLALGAAAYDYLLSRILVENGHAVALNWAGPLLLVALATPLVDRFVRVLSEAENARAQLETRIREREQLLKRNYEKLRESERLQVQAQERQRIMQDMHDGLGSQLLSSLMLVERGAVTQPQVVQILRECIDDMRLAIDALAAEDAGLLSALGNLRFRVEPRLRAAGINLTWDARGLPEELDINPDAVLPILRIIQETLTNALKHSKAQAVQVFVAVEHLPDEGNWLLVRISDNGQGISEERVGGRGLLNMRNRANKIGAQLKIESVPGRGTLVALRFKLDWVDPMSTTAQQLGANTQAAIEHARQ